MARVVEVKSNFKKVLLRANKSLDMAYGEHIRKTQEDAVKANPKGVKALIVICWIQACKRTPNHDLLLSRFMLAHESRT